MKKIGLFYPAQSIKTANIATKIKEAFAEEEIGMVAIEKAVKGDFESYECLIAGASTWFDGELPTYWDEALPELSLTDLKGKKVAIFGLGDQAGYPDNFADGVGILAQRFEKAGATVVGYTSAEGYTFDHSLALRDGRFMGLVIDMENQPEKTNERIAKWTDQLKSEFGMK